MNGIRGTVRRVRIDEGRCLFFFLLLCFLLFCYLFFLSPAVTGDDEVGADSLATRTITVGRAGFPPSRRRNSGWEATLPAGVGPRGLRPEAPGGAW